MPPLSLYIHFPWCKRKCPYCDFNSFAISEKGLDEEPYLQALIRDFDIASDATTDRELTSIFIGGGTPSLFSPASLEKLLEHIHRKLNFASDIEISMEANPGAIEHHAFSDYQTAGINRISLGIQSLNDAALKRLGRIHNSQEARSAITSALKIFANVNLDFMFALPEQSDEELEFDIDSAIASGATHLSFYQLTIEEGTAFAKKLPSGLPNADRAAQMSEFVEQKLNAAGFEHYEVSGYAKPHRRCRHNLNYWSFGDYLGIGAGAHGKLTFSDGKIMRGAKHKNPAKYMSVAPGAKVDFQNNPYLEASRELSDADVAFEFMLNVLRLKEGVPRSSFMKMTERSPEILRRGLDEAIRRGLMENDETRFVATERGYRFLNDTMEIFL
jgi:oxygen-independent coproporphyrinogen-3 oxidase